MKVSDKKLKNNHPIEDMIYAELWKRDIQRKEAREREELLERQKRVEERNNVLGWQKQTNQHRKDQDKNQAESEKQMLVYICILS